MYFEKDFLLITDHYKSVTSLRNPKPKVNKESCKIKDQSFVDLISSDDDSLLISEKPKVQNKFENVPQSKYKFNDSSSDDDVLNIPLSQRLGYNNLIKIKNVTKRKSPLSSPNDKNFIHCFKKHDIVLEMHESETIKKIQFEEGAEIKVNCFDLPFEKEQVQEDAELNSKNFNLIIKEVDTKKNKLKRKTQKDLMTKLEKDRKKAERIEAKKIKEKNRLMYKERSKAIKEAASAQNIVGCEKLCQTFVDSQICESSIFKELLENCFAVNNAPLTLTCNPIVPFSVSWIREVRNLVETECLNQEDNDIPLSQLNVVYENQEQNQLLIILYEKDFIPMCNASKQKLNQKLDDTLTLHKYVIDTLKTYQKNLTLVFYGYQNYLKKLRNQENKNFLIKTGFEKSKKNRSNLNLNLPSVKKVDLEIAIIDTLVRLNDNSDFNHYNVNIIMAENSADLVRIISSTTKAVAMNHAKFERRNQYGLDWYAQGDNFGTVDLKEEKDFITLWIRQLTSFPKISYDMAQAIAAVYPSPQSLLHEYKRCLTLDHQINLLSNIEVTRLSFKGTTIKKIGSSISQKIHKFLTTRYGNEFLN